MPVEITEYKGRPMIKLMREENDLYPFIFGLTKAKLILENIDAIEKFVKENE